MTEWMAYEQVTGVLGPERYDQLHGILCSVITNVNSSKKGKKAKPKDFIPPWDRRREQSWEEQLAAVKSMNAAMGGTDLTRQCRTCGARGTCEHTRQSRRRKRRR